MRDHRGSGFGGLACAKRLARADVDVTLRRPAQLPHVPAAAVPGRHRGPERGRRRVRGARHLPREGERLVPASDRDRRRLGRATRSNSTAARNRRSRSTIWSWPRARRRPTSASRARPSSRSRSTTSSTPSRCATTSSAGSKPPTPTHRCSTTASLTFVIVGGGPTGVEVAGAMAELFSMVLRKDFHDPRRRPGPSRARRDGRRAAAPVLARIATQREGATRRRRRRGAHRRSGHAR